MKYIKVDNERTVMIFVGPQDPEQWPDLIEVEDDDPRYVDFLGLLKPTPEAEALSTRDELLRTAAIRIAPLQDALDLGKATEVEGQALIAWKEYRVELNHLQEQPGFPTEINWPLVPS